MFICNSNYFWHVFKHCCLFIQEFFKSNVFWLAFSIINIKAAAASTGIYGRRRAKSSSSDIAELAGFCVVYCALLKLCWHFYSRMIRELFLLTKILTWFIVVYHLPLLFTFLRFLSSKKRRKKVFFLQRSKSFFTFSIVRKKVLNK